MIEFRALDLQTDKIRADLISGYFGPASVRGRDWVIPGAEGQEIRARIKDSLQHELRIHVIGFGTDEQERAEDWHNSMLALMAVLQFDLAPGTLEVGDGYLGFPSGETATIDARPINIVYGPILNCASYQLLSVELESKVVDWVVGS